MDITRIDEIYPWRETFAWIPVKTISNKWVWFKPIWKRKLWVRYGASFHYEPIIEYGTVFDVVKSQSIT